MQLVDECFTERARKVMILANEEAARLNQPHVGTLHILLGLTRAGMGEAAMLLQNRRLTLEQVHTEVEHVAPQSVDTAPPTAGSDTAGRETMERAVEEAHYLGQKYVGTGHLLLALLSSSGLPAKILRDVGLTLEAIRADLLQLVGAGPLARPKRRLALDAAINEMPPEERQALLELETRIEQLIREKETAIERQDYETAAHLRDLATELEAQEEAFLLRIGRSDPDTTA
jgi:DNA-binding transcriptional MerR regulator